MFVNGVLRKISGSKRDEVTGEWRILHNEERYDLYTPYQFIVQVMKSSRIKWAGHVARIGRRDLYTGFWLGNLRERDHWEDLGVDGRIILKFIFKKWDGGIWIILFWLRIWAGDGRL